MKHGMATLPERVDTHNEGREEQPRDTDGNPSGKELLGEDIAGAVERERPEHEQDESHDDGDDTGDLGRAVELALFLLLVGFGTAGDLGKVEVVLGGDVVVVALLDGAHGLVVVVVGAESEGEDGDEDAGREKRNDVADKHGVVGARGSDRDLAVGLLGVNEPASEGADEAEDGGEGCSPLVLLLPEEGERSGKDGGGDDDTHEEVEVAHGDTGVVEAGGEGGHRDAEADDAGVGHVDEALAAGGGVEVGLWGLVGWACRRWGESKPCRRRR